MNLPCLNSLRQTSLFDAYSPIESLPWQHASNAILRQLAQRLTQDTYAIEGKTTHKAEFVTAGGVNGKEVDFRTLESRVCPRLFFAGAILDVDGITGDFNLPNVWTTGFLAAYGARGIGSQGGCDQED